ncbi:hypothetical protein CCACVL1_18530, partial [Corchorus capsularis]
SNPIHQKESRQPWFKRVASISTVHLAMGSADLWRLISPHFPFSTLQKPLSAGSVPYPVAFPLPFVSHNAFDRPAADGCPMVLRLSLV